MKKIVINFGIGAQAEKMVKNGMESSWSSILWKIHPFSYNIQKNMITSPGYEAIPTTMVNQNEDRWAT